jgi:hypothetical protein
LPGEAEAGFFYPDIRPGYGVTSQAWLSKYFPPLKGTNLDTPVFYLDSGKPGATALLIAGSHGREIGGFTAALVLLENTEVLSGRVVVIPLANRSAVSVPDTLNRIPRFHPVDGRSGRRYLPYGDRLTDEADHGKADPQKYTPPSGGAPRKGAESRNLNRVYPGRAEGVPTEQLAYAILELIRREKVDFCLDLHETSTPEPPPNDRGDPSGNRLAYMLICHPRGAEIGAKALSNLEAETGISGKLGKSKPGSYGFSHLEIGNAADCLSFLYETPNPGMDRWRERPEPIADPKYPLEHRVGAALRVFKHLADAFALKTGKEVTTKGLPGYAEIMKKGIGAYLN